MMALQLHWPHVRGLYGWIVPFPYVGAKNPVKLSAVVLCDHVFCHPLFKLYQRSSGTVSYGYIWGPKYLR